MSQVSDRRNWQQPKVANVAFWVVVAALFVPLFWPCFLRTPVFWVQPGMVAPKVAQAPQPYNLGPLRAVEGL